MLDFKGQLLNIGDKVIFTIDDFLMEGEISKIMKVQCDIKCTTTLKDGQLYIQIRRVRYPGCQVFKLGNKE